MLLLRSFLDNPQCEITANDRTLTTDAKNHVNKLLNQIQTSKPIHADSSVNELCAHEQMRTYLITKGYQFHPCKDTKEMLANAQECGDFQYVLPPPVEEYQAREKKEFIGSASLMDIVHHVYAGACFYPFLCIRISSHPIPDFEQHFNHHCIMNKKQILFSILTYSRTHLSITTLGDSFRLHPGTPKGDTIQGIPSAREKRKYRVLFAEFFNPRNVYMLLGQTRAKYGADVEIVVVVPLVPPEMVHASDGDAIYGGIRSLRERIQEKVERCFPPNPSLTIIGMYIFTSSFPAEHTLPRTAHPSLSE